MRWLKSLKLPKLSAPKRAISDCIDVLGLGCLNAAAYWWHPIVGLVATGIILCFVGWVMDQ
jgi:hypothetical protein